MLVFLIAILGSCAPQTGEGEAGSAASPDQSDRPFDAPQLPAPGAGEDFYALPGVLPEGSPGTLLRLEPISAPAGARGWRVLYHSTALDGRDIAVSGLVFAPDRPAVAGTRAVVAWGHGSLGLGDGCALSRSPEEFIGSPLFTELLDDDFVLAATDYEGLGTPGPHPWLVGKSEGRSMLDAVRAAARISETGAGERFVAFGASQGGGAALFAGELAPGYAEELELLGVVAAAPAAELDLLVLLAEGQLVAGIGGFLVMGAFGFAAAYPQLPLEAILPASVISQRQEVEQLCQDQIERRFRGVPIDRLLITSPGSVPEWAGVITENTPGRRRTTAPVLLVHGNLDRVVPQEVSQLLYQRLCGIGVDTERQLYGGVGHGEVVGASGDDVIEWIGDRAAGRDRSSHPDRQLC